MVALLSLGATNYKLFPGRVFFNDSQTDIVTLIIPQDSTWLEQWQLSLLMFLVPNSDCERQEKKKRVTLTAAVAPKNYIARLFTGPILKLLVSVNHLHNIFYKHNTNI